MLRGVKIDQNPDTKKRPRGPSDHLALTNYVAQIPCSGALTTLLAAPFPRAQIRCYDHDVVGPADLIGCVTLGPDAILAMVDTVNTDNDVAESPCRPDAPAEVTWLELTSDSSRSSTSKVVSRETGIIHERNPFKSLGDIAVAVAVRRALPNSMEEYRRSNEEEQSKIDAGRAIADSGVLVSVADEQQ